MAGGEEGEGTGKAILGILGAPSLFLTAARGGVCAKEGVEVRESLTTQVLGMGGERLTCCGCPGLGLVGWESQTSGALVKKNVSLSLGERLVSLLPDTTRPSTARLHGDSPPFSSFTWGRRETASRP